MKVKYAIKEKVQNLWQGKRKAIKMWEVHQANLYRKKCLKIIIKITIHCRMKLSLVLIQLREVKNPQNNDDN